MADATAVEKRLDQAALEAGLVSLTSREVSVLELPEYSTQIGTMFGGATVRIEWSATNRTLRGEEFADLIQMDATVGSVLRLARSGDELELQLVEAAGTRLTSSYRRPVSEPAAATVQEKPARPKTQLRDERFRIRERDEYDWSGGVGIFRRSVESLTQNIAANGWDAPESFELRLRGEKLAAVNSFDELLAINLARVEHMPHQISTAMKVLADMQGRAILADEVGLGKTIEAGFILKELTARGLVRSVLILCPATLREQWVAELRDKFDEMFTVVTSGSEPLDADKIIMSTTLGRRHAARVHARDFDMVIVDEAHKGINGAKTRELLRGFDSRYVLFLTATPVQNKLDELFHLVDVLKPGTFASLADFRSRYVKAKDQRTPRDPAQLRRLVSDVMVRTTRSQAGLDTVQRIAKDHAVQLSAVERQAYELCTELLRGHLNAPTDHLRRRHLAHRLTCSPRALGQTARRMAAKVETYEARRALNEIADLSIDFGITSRQHRVLALLHEWTTDPSKGKALVFTQHTDTAQDLLRILDEQGLAAVPFHGGMSHTQKRLSIDKFRGDTAVLVSTDAGAEGLNLQFANCVLNYDLPWNPMRIEQRIGRVHRVTQTRDVHVANFFAAGTIDEKVYRLLHDKLRMFELLFGQVTTILGEIEDDDGRSFESQVLDAYLARDDREMANRLDMLGKSLDGAWRSTTNSIEKSDHLSSWFFSTEYRAAIPDQGATELRPAAAGGTSSRHVQVVDFVQDYLNAHAIEVSKTTDDVDGVQSFLSASLPEGVLRGRTDLHLAFSLEGLGMHPEAQLCAVGSEVFEELVESLRDSGDLLAYMPAKPEGVTQPGPACDDLRFVRREYVGPLYFGGKSVFRVRSSHGSSGERVVEIEFGEGHDKSTGRVLSEGDRLPGTFNDFAHLVGQAVEMSVEQLDDERAVIASEVEEAHRSEQARLDRYYKGLIEERQDQLSRSRSGPQKQDHRSVLNSLVEAQQAQRRGRAPDVELTADLLAIEIVGSTEAWEVSDRWRTSSGAEVVVAGTYLSEDGSTTYAVGDRELVQLAVCSNLHPCESSERETCPLCHDSHCTDCGDAYQRIACTFCKVRACSACIPDDICSVCVAPARVPDHDRPGAAAWALGSGCIGYVSPRTIEIVQGDGVRQLFANAELVPEGFGRLVHAARQAGCGPDVGLRASIEPPADFGLPTDALAVQQDQHVLISSGPGDLVVDDDAMALLPETADDFSAMSASQQALHVKLSVHTPVSQTTTLEVVVEFEHSWLEITGEGVARKRQRTTRGVQHGHETEHFSWSGPDKALAVGLVYSIPVAGCDGTEMTVRVGRLNAGYVVAASQSRTSEVVYAGGDPDSSPEAEHAAAFLAMVVGATGSLVTVGHIDPDAPPPLSPEAAELVERQTRRLWVEDSGRVGRRLVSADVPFVDPQPRYRSSLRVLTPAVFGALRNFDQSRPEVCVSSYVEVDERWRSGDREATITYRPLPDNPGLPFGPDRRMTDFEVDHHGHLYPSGEGWGCPACETIRCELCGPGGVLGACAACDRTACHGCRHDPQPIEDRTCAVCATSSCLACGTALNALSCSICGDWACRASCAADGRCLTCVAVSDGRRGRVSLPAPPELNWPTGAARLRSDHQKLVLAASFGDRQELVIIKNGTVIRWLRSMPFDEELFRAQRAIGSPWPAEFELVHEPDDTETLVIHSWGQPAVSWVRTDPGSASPQAGASTTKEFSDPIAALATLDEGGVPGVDQRISNLFSWEAQPSPAEPVQCRVQSFAFSERVSVSGAGLVHDIVDQSGWRQKTQPWASDSGDRVGHWDPRPDRVIASSAGPVWAGLLQTAHFAHLAILRGEDVILRPLSGEAGYPGLAQLRERLGVRHPIDVASYLAPVQTRFISPMNAELVERNVKVIGRTTQLPAHRAAAGRAVRAVTSARTSASPEVTRWLGPESLQAALLAMLWRGEPPTVTVYDVGQEVSEQWQLDGRIVELSHELFEDSYVATMDHPVTGDRLSTGYLDRSGHLVHAGDLARCRYCKEQSCGACATAVLRCPICQIDVCVLCRPAADPAVCGACSDLQPLGMIARRRRAKGAKVALESADDFHSVLVALLATGRCEVRCTSGSEDWSHQLDLSVPGLSDLLNRASDSQAF